MREMLAWAKGNLEMTPEQRAEKIYNGIGTPRKLEEEIEAIAAEIKAAVEEDKVEIYTLHRSRWNNRNVV